MKKPIDNNRVAGGCTILILTAIVFFGFIYSLGTYGDNQQKRCEMECIGLHAEVNQDKTCSCYLLIETR